MTLHQELSSLRREAAHLLQLPEPDLFADSGKFTLDDISVGLFQEEEATGSAAYCYVDLGPVEGPDRDINMEKLLAINLAANRHSGAVIGFDMESRHAVLTVKAHEDALSSGVDLAAFLTGMLDFTQDLQLRVTRQNGDRDANRFLALTLA